MEVVMKKTIFTGAGTALITPFTEDGVDYDSLGKLIEFQISEGIDAIVSCGTTGEASTMPDDEHLEVIKYTVEKVAGRVPVIAGTGSNDTRHSIKLSEKAAEYGADAILSVTPYYNKTTQRGLYEHFKATADSVDIPVVLYNVPSRTGVNINPETVLELYGVENIVAVKECNISQLAELARIMPEDFSIYSGNDDQVIYNLIAGGKGIISVLSNVVPKYVHQMTSKYFADHDIEGCRRMQLDALPLINAIMCEVNPIPVKTAVSLMGMCEDRVRMPLVTMSEKNRPRLVEEMKKFNLI